MTDELRGNSMVLGTSESSFVTTGTVKKNTDEEVKSLLEPIVLSALQEVCSRTSFLTFKKNDFIGRLTC